MVASLRVKAAVSSERSQNQYLALFVFDLSSNPDCTAYELCELGNSHYSISLFSFETTTTKLKNHSTF